MPSPKWSLSRKNPRIGIWEEEPFKNSTKNLEDIKVKTIFQATIFFASRCLAATATAKAVVSGNFCELLFLIRGFRHLCKIYNDSGILATLKKRLPLLLEFRQPLGQHFPHASCKLMYQVIVLAVISWTILHVGIMTEKPALFKSEAWSATWVELK